MHPNVDNVAKSDDNIIERKKDRIKKPVYDILSYTMSVAVKMTALANPNHIVIGQLVYDMLDESQKSAFQPINLLNG